MKSIKAIIFFLVCSISYCQAEIFEGFYVTNEKDTIDCQFKVGVNLFREDKINPLSIRKKLTVIAYTGEKKIFKPFQIQAFLIKGTKEGDMLFESYVLNGKKWFVEVLAKGKVNLYKYYFPHSYDYSPQFQYVVDRTNQPPKALSPIPWRNQLKTYFPEEQFFIDAIEKDKAKYADLPNLITQYNALLTTETNLQ